MWVGGGGFDDYRGCYVIGEKFDVKFDVTVFDVNSPFPFTVVIICVCTQNVPGENF